VTPIATPRRNRFRALISGALIVLGITAVSTGVVATHARRVLFNAGAFANRTAASLDDPRVATFIADRAASAIIQRNRDLTPYRPLLATTARTIVSTDAFRAMVRTAARRAHQAAMSESGRKVVLSVPDLDVLLRSALARAKPDLAAKIPPAVSARIGGSDEGTVKALFDIYALGTRLMRLALAGIAGGILLIVAGVVLAVHRSKILFRTGVGLVIGAGILLVGLPVGRAVVSSLVEDPLAKGMAAGLWDAFTAGIRPWALLMSAIGVILASATRSVFERVELVDQIRRFIDWCRERPGGRPAQFLRGGLLLATGVLAMWSPGTAVSLLVLLAGAGLAFVGLGELFTALLSWLPEEVVVERVLASRRGGWSRVVIVSALALALGAGVILLGRRSTAPPVMRFEACNGATELCDRPLDQVVFPGAHNSMSSEDTPGWMFPQQEKGIRTQLADGIRALLIDAHYGRPVGDRVKTDIESEQGSAEKYEEALGAEGVAAAMRIRDRLVGLEEGPRGVYLCHGFCELGAIPLVEALHAVHEFLIENPNEIVLMVVEDYVEPGDLAAAFTETGLVELVYRGPVAPPWPKLSEMIDEGQRLVVFSESGRTGVPWLRPAFETLQETPYTFHRPEDFSCAPNRGGTQGSLFQINHWIDTAPTPLPKNATIVNAYDFLLERVRRCQAERGRLPNVVAVDFYRTGDLFRVVRALNDVGAPALTLPAP
jgi:hypothetical protein